MILDLREFDSYPIKTVVTGDPEKFHIDYENFKRIIKIEEHIDIQSAGEEYFCQAELRAEIELECARCLGVFSQKINSHTNFIVCFEQLHENEPYKDNEDYVYFSGGDLTADLTENVTQSIILELSLKPLCSDDCRGLCSQCGINLNESDCDCIKENIDPRWEALKKLSGKTLDSKE